MQQKDLKEISVMFERYGIRSVSMDDISRHLGISKKTLYQHFKDKNELVEKVTRIAIKEREMECEQIATTATNSIEELFLMSKFLRKDIADLNPSLLYDMKKYHPNAWGLFRDFESITIYEGIRDNLKRGKKEGFFRNEISIDVLAKLRVEQVHMSFDPDVFPKDKFDFVEVHIQMFDHYVYGILTTKGFKLYEKYKQKN